MSLKLDLGCGQGAKEGFIGLDTHPAQRDDQGDWSNVSQVVDLTQGIPYPDYSVDEIYSGHFFEHLGKTEVLPMLKECWRVLKIGGVIDIIVPDLDKVLQNFINADPNKKDGWDLDTIFGGQAHAGEFHKTGFWPERAQQLFEVARFSDIVIEEIFGWGQPCLEIKARK